MKMAQIDFSHYDRFNSERLSHLFDKYFPHSLFTRINTKNYIYSNHSLHILLIYFNSHVPFSKNIKLQTREEEKILRRLQMHTITITTTTTGWINSRKCFYFDVNSHQFNCKMKEKLCINWKLKKCNTHTNKNGCCNRVAAQS